MAHEFDRDKAFKRMELERLFDQNFDLGTFIKNGTATNVTAANVGTFLATIANNYRTKKAQIAAAATQSALNAINIRTGWPNNP